MMKNEKPPTLTTEQLQRDFARERWFGEIQLFLEQMTAGAPDGVDGG